MRMKPVACSLLESRSGGPATSVAFPLVRCRLYYASLARLCSPRMTSPRLIARAYTAAVMTK